MTHGVENVGRIRRDAKILFVCTHNVVRSVCGEAVFRAAGCARVRSAGTWAPGSQACTDAAVAWADIIIVFEDAHRTWLCSRRDVRGKDIRVLGVGDDYDKSTHPVLVAKMERLAADLLKR